MLHGVTNCPINRLIKLHLILGILGNNLLPGLSDLQNGLAGPQEPILETKLIRHTRNTNFVNILRFQTYLCYYIYYELNE